MSHKTVQHIFLSHCLIMKTSHINYRARRGHPEDQGEKMSEFGRLYVKGLKSGIFYDKLDLIFEYPNLEYIERIFSMISDS